MSAFDELREKLDAYRKPAKATKATKATTPGVDAGSVTAPDTATTGAPVVMTRAELAKALRVSQNTITNWVSRGMPCFYIGKLKTNAKGSKPRFVFADCLAWVQRGEF